MKFEIPDSGSEEESAEAGNGAGDDADAGDGSGAEEGDPAAPDGGMDFDPETGESGGEGESPDTESNAATADGLGDLDDLTEDEGRIVGTIVDEDTQAPVQGVAVVLEGTDAGTITDQSGQYVIPAAPEGTYTISLVKSGYIESNVTEFEVPGGEIKRFDFALPPRPTEMSDEVYELQDFTVTEEQATQMMANIELRMDSDALMNFMGGEDLSRFASSDVSEAVKRVAGVTVQEGKFAVIRGLDERYSTSLLNGTPVPSPDPDRQSVPLDLFPAEIVQNLAVTKTYSADLPGNSAGGSIDIRTNEFPDELTIRLSAGGGINGNAKDRFLEPSQSREGIGFDDVLNINERTKQDFGGVPEDKDSEDVIDREFALEIGNTLEFKGRELRFLSSLSHDRSFDTAQGVEQQREARIQDVENGEIVDQTFTEPRFDFTESEDEEQLTFLTALEGDLDEEGRHTIGYTFFHTNTEEEFASLRENGFFPGKVAPPSFGSAIQRRFETDQRIDSETSGDDGLPVAVRTIVGRLPGGTGQGLNDDIMAFYEELSLADLIVLETERELEIHQFNGTHELIDGDGQKLDFSWAWSSAEASQEENDAFRVGALEVPELFGGGFVSGQLRGFEALQPDRSWRRIEENQDFYRADLTYERELSDTVTVTPSFGIFDEDTTRDTDQFFTRVGMVNLGQAAQVFPTLEEAINGNLSGTPESNFQPGAVARGERQSQGFYFSTKLSLFDKLDVIGGVRFEDFDMSTETRTSVGGDDFFNSGILQGADNIAAQRNTRLLGINGGEPLPPGFTGEIEEDLALPAITVNYRPWEGGRATFGYSQTNVRPSFKEFTFVSVRDPVTLDLESGNPALETSDVESFDLRFEHTFNDLGDRAAVSLFYKSIDNPIEKTNLSNTDIHFNNPNSASLKGVEFEFRKNLGFAGPEFFEFFSVGGNFAYIDAEVDNPETFRDRLKDSFGVENPEKSRRLFQQPEWIVNADLRFEHPDWGTSATLSLFAQSKVLDSAGGFRGRNAATNVFESPFNEVNFTLYQRINDTFSFKFSAKNLTDSTRGLEFEDEVGGGNEREFTVGREFSLSVTAEF